MAALSLAGQVADPGAGREFVGSMHAKKLSTLQLPVLLVGELEIDTAAAPGPDIHVEFAEGLLCACTDHHFVSQQTGGAGVKYD